MPTAPPDVPSQAASADLLAHPSAEAALPARYEEALAELERLVQAMEASQMPLDSLLDCYRRGAALLESCRARLQAVESQIKVLEDGQLRDWSGD